MKRHSTTETALPPTNVGAVGKLGIRAVQFSLLEVLVSG
jgi:hypothetical protein